MRGLAIFVLTITTTVAAWAQSASVPTLDGKLSASEYADVQEQGGITVAAHLSDDGSTLYVAVSAPTKGWVAIGVGSTRMDGSYMILGYSIDGAQSVSFERGKGHSHSPAPAPGAKAALTEVDGVTTLEASFPAASFVKDGKLPTIAAYGNKDDFRSIHARKTALVLMP
ncbi:MAG: hypothetical protein KKA67_00135 [Spirochaetes bacterium]|nr:hypothetical protein [Spirochaetota bacterium]MBU1078897.1 hypothetical protein [Spirochaetota bacterium]